MSRASVDILDHKKTLILKTIYKTAEERRRKHEILNTMDSKYRFLPGFSYVKSKQTKLLARVHNSYFDFYVGDYNLELNPLFIPGIGEFVFL